MFLIHHYRSASIIILINIIVSSLRKVLIVLDSDLIKFGFNLFVLVFGKSSTVKINLSRA